jgi:hypothetical protein
MKPRMVSDSRLCLGFYLEGQEDMAVTVVNFDKQTYTKILYTMILSVTLMSHDNRLPVNWVKGFIEFINLGTEP